MIRDPVIGDVIIVGHEEVLRKIVRIDSRAGELTTCTAAGHVRLVHVFDLISCRYPSRRDKHRPFHQPGDRGVLIDRRVEVRVLRSIEPPIDYDTPNPFRHGYEWGYEVEVFPSRSHERMLVQEDAIVPVPLAGTSKPPPREIFSVRDWQASLRDEEQQRERAAAAAATAEALRVAGLLAAPPRDLTTYRYAERMRRRRGAGR